ncbi:hypothetical protein BGX38DRAFT_1269954 [Terfezia claveryi]|nr:hypothetical protein BGX38DRAFT_1269954 [Terfezia claveryi]
MVGKVGGSWRRGSVDPASTREWQLKLIKCFSLLFLGMALSALATLNFSLVPGVGVGSTVLTFIPVEGNGKIVRGAMYVVLQCLSPGMALVGIACYWGVGMEELLREASFGLWVSGRKMVEEEGKGEKKKQTVY